MASDKAESSRAREEAAAEREGEEESAVAVAPEHRRSWVALASIPLLCGADDATRAEAMAPGVADLLLELHEPPRASYLALPERVAPGYKRRGPEDEILPKIVAAAPARLLVSGVNSDLYWCDVRAGTAYRLPAVPANLPVKLFPEPNLGLVADPSSPGDYMIVRLHPTPQASRMRHSALLCFSTAPRSRAWCFKPLDSAPKHEPWYSHCVFAHDGFLWWVDVAQGMLFCNPFDNNPGLRLVPLPNGCAVPGVANRVHFSRLLDKRRCVRLSEGKLRYIQITATGLSYNLATISDPPDNPTVSMWTLKALADQQDAADPWTWEYEVPFDQIWNHHKYLAAGLPRGKVPNLALVDPYNHYVIYFFHEGSLFGWDAEAKEFVSCEHCWMNQDVDFQYSRFVYAWKWEQPTTACSSSGGGSVKKLPDHMRLILVPFEGKREDIHRNIIQINAPAPFPQQPPANVPAQLEAQRKDARKVVEDSIRQVQQKLNQETNCRKLQKLLRQRKHLRQTLNVMMDANEGQK